MVHVKELIKARNEADQLAYSTEKTLKEPGDKISDDEKKTVNEKLEKLRSVLGSESAETINAAKEELMQASHKLAEEMYKQSAAQQAAGEQPGADMGADAGPTGQPGGTGPEAEEEKPKGDGAVDADFEVVDDNKEK